jgi:hypothetical protein
MTNTETNVRQLLRDRYFKKEGDKVLTTIETAEEIIRGRDELAETLRVLMQTINTTSKDIRKQVNNIEDAVHNNNKQHVIDAFAFLKSFETQMKAKEIVAFTDGIEVLSSLHTDMVKAAAKREIK